MKVLSAIFFVTVFFQSGISQDLKSFKFKVGYEWTYTLGQPRPTSPTKMKQPKTVLFDNNILSIINQDGTQYSKYTITRVIEFRKDKLVSFALEYQDKSGLYSYYRYIERTNASNEISKSLVIPYNVNGQIISEDTLFED
jgi:hypothetical protein